MGRSVGVSPVMVILAVFAFSSLLGITGAFLAIPLAAILQVLMDHLVVHAGVMSTEEPGEVSTNIMSKMRAQIRRLRAEGLQRLRTGHGRITLSTGDRDDVDSRVDNLLNKADQALTVAAQTAGTDTAEVHTALLAEVDLAINQGRRDGRGGQCRSGDRASKREGASRTTGMKLKLAWSLLADTFSKWNEHKAIRLGAALAYFGIFAIAPVLIIAIAIAGLVYGRAAAEGNIVRSISGVVGSSNAQFVQGLVESASQPGAGVIAAVVGVAGIVLGSAGLFFQLKDALNTVWEVAPKPGYRLVDMMRDNALSFAMVLGLGVLVLASLLLSAGLNAVGSLLGSAVPGSETVWRLADFGLSFGLATLLFAGIFKILPDVRIPWGDVWPGAILTALLFAVAQVALGVIIRLANPGLAFGAAGALVVILVWVDLASLILLFGAEFVRVYSRRIRLACSTQGVCRGAHSGS